MSTHGSKSPYTATLFPYGYVPIYAAVTGSPGPNMAVTVTMSAGTTQVGAFTFGENGR